MRLPSIGVIRIVSNDDVFGSNMTAFHTAKRNVPISTTRFRGSFMSTEKQAKQLEGRNNIHICFNRGYLVLDI